MTKVRQDGASPAEPRTGEAVVPPWVATGTFLRAFTIQSSWNYRTMIGTGFGYALIPVLRHLYPDPADLERATARHAELFNAHPYLANVALGAVTRLEAQGVDERTVARFKAALRGPLGALGDTLVWAAWLPVVSLLAIALAWLGTPPAWTVLGFLVVYNVGHLALRLWAFRLGLREGRAVGGSLRGANFGVRADRIRGAGACLVGLVVGLLLTGEPSFAPERPLWIPLGAAAFCAGLFGGQRLWRPAAFAVVGAVVALVVLHILF